MAPSSSSLSRRKVAADNPAADSGIKLGTGTSGEPQRTGTLTWDELEEWQKDNEYIVRGYRRLQYNWRGTIASVFTYVHNETVNIHSHLLGCALFVYFLGTFYSAHVERHENTTWHDSAVIGVFLAAAVFCLAASAFYHTSGCHSKEVATRCHAFDYSGIIVLIVGSFIPSIYYGFYCHAWLQQLYLSTMTLAGLGAAFVVLDAEYAKPTHRGARTAIFIGLGLCAVVPVTHLALTHGIHELVNEMGANWLFTSGALYIGGALLYANRIPERMAPGKFDILLASHQIFHFCVVLAAFAHYQGVLKSLRFRMSHPMCG
ncbi:HlyIII-domain-containing protein [Agrocybe pediades]|nr:HlyIII-domain-containing protein [Agrocybe pediades]